MSRRFTSERAMVEEVLRRVVNEAAAGRPVALCIIVATRGSTPQPVGTMVCVDRAAQMAGTLGGGCVEADVRRQAHQCLSGRASRLTTFTLDHDFGYDDGMLCGGQMDVAIAVYSAADEAIPLVESLRQLECGFSAEISLRLVQDGRCLVYRIRVASAPKLVIVGGGHIGRILARMMVAMDFRVTVLDDRPMFANKDRFPPPIACVEGDIATTLKEWAIDANTYVVIVTRGHRHDEAALRSVLSSPARYLGMIGSRRKIQVVYDDLRHEGALEDQLARVHAPIGLNIGAVTAEEIALSIAAELVSVRRIQQGAAAAGLVVTSSIEP